MADPFVRTFAACKIGVARAVDDFIADVTASAGSTTTFVAAALTDATDARLKGAKVYCYDGTGQSQETVATAFTAGSDTVTVPTQGTAFASGSKILLTRRFGHADILDAIRRTLYQYGRWGKTYHDQSLIFGSPLVNATFYDNSGTFPNGWTLTGSGGTVARVSDISKHGRYAAGVLSSGAAARGFYQDVSNIALYRGLSATLRGWVFCNTASRCNILLDDGIDTTTGIYTITGTNEGWGSAERVTAGLAVSARATRLRASCNITDGSAVQGYFSGLWITPVLWREWPIPAGSPTAIIRVNFEDGYDDGGFLLPCAQDAIEIVRETTRRIRLNSRSAVAGRIIEIMGRTSWADHATAATDDDTNFDAMYEWLVPAAGATLLRMKGRHDKDDKAHAADLDAEAAKAMRNMPSLPASAIKIETGTA